MRRRVFCNWWIGTKQSSRMRENERDAERYEYERDTERDRSPCYEEARVERNVRDFVDEDVDLFATPVGSDDDQDANEGNGYFTYKKGSGELQLKQAFDSLQDFKQAMVDYVLKYGWNVKYVRWDKDKSELKWASEAEEGEEACMWRIYCSYEAPLQKWMVKVYVKDHSCSKSGYSRLITQEVIAKLFKDDLRDDPKIMPKEILGLYSEALGIDGDHRSVNAKTRALEMIKEENDQHFSRLRDYRLELLESNEDSTVELETFNGDDGSDVFYRFYVCFAALKKTWCAHCRPIFGLDACFLKCTTKGQLLVAVGRDANNKMFPIAWAVVDVESEDNWVWFIEKLQTDLNLHDGEGFTIISDRQMVIILNLAFFTPSSTCDDVSNNISESFNHAVDPARSMPLVEMLETIRRRAMLRIEARKMRAMNHRGKFSLKAMEKVSEEKRKIRHCTIYPCGYEVFEVKEKNSSYKTKMVDRTCTCRKWEGSNQPTQSQVVD
ncbi:LOW QUALITY PROTEIN: hypothetical protein HID58_082218 [Brassica napus]|uniref:MULE transposase domain-containing protein n=1 Tax=Brassica napus TaxID=3708 RepID=A0ABQ7YA11_BRANA|nr:LOW QUALITY PROTEIN: hypothetical protein HID58_082218 [Brassica napus]